MSDVIEAAAQRILARTGNHSSEDFGNYNEKDDPPLVARAYLAMLVAQAAPHAALRKILLPFLQKAAGKKGTVSVDEWCAALDETDAALAGRCCADAPAPAEDDEGLREALEKDALRYRYLREHCSSHYPMSYDPAQPAEWSIGWEFQQGKPHERFGTFDSWIDRDIERLDPEERAALSPDRERELR